MKIKCACCGEETIEEEYDICPVCGWEKDRVQEKFIGMRGGANRLSLAEARELYRECGYTDERLKKHLPQNEDDIPPSGTDETRTDRN